MTTNTQLEECKKKLWDLTVKLVTCHVSFHPPLEGIRLENIKKNNPYGYNLLQEYLELLKEEKELKDKQE